MGKKEKDREMVGIEINMKDATIGDKARIVPIRIIFQEEPLNKGKTKFDLIAGLKQMWDNFNSFFLCGFFRNEILYKKIHIYEFDMKKSKFIKKVK